MYNEHILKIFTLNINCAIIFITKIVMKLKKGGGTKIKIGDEDTV